MRNPDREKIFRFKRFEVANHLSAMKVGTDGVLLGAWALFRREGIGLLPPARILDVGCGTGLIALIKGEKAGKVTYKVSQKRRKFVFYYEFC